MLVAANLSGACQCIKDWESKINATPPRDEKNVSTVETPKDKPVSGVGTDAGAKNPLYR